MNISDEAVEAAVPWINDFMERRGFALRGKEAEALAAYVLAAAAPHIIAAWINDTSRLPRDLPGYGPEGAAGAGE